MLSRNLQDPIKKYCISGYPIINLLKPGMNGYHYNNGQRKRNKYTMII